MKNSTIYKSKRWASLIVLFVFFCSSVVYGQTLIYTQDFSASTPTGWATSNSGTGNDWSLTDTDTPYNGSYSMRYLYHSTNAANAWAYTQGVAMVAGRTYSIQFYQNTASISGTYPEKLKVTVGTAQTAAAQTTTLYTNSSLTNETYTNRTSSDYVCSSTGTYYFGFNCFSAADQNALFVDNVRIYETIPTYCTASSNTSFNDGITSVEINTLSNQDLVNTNAGYEDFTAMSTTLQQSSNYSLSIKLNTDGAYTEYCKVYIDWNNDLTFDPSTEEYSLGSVNTNADGLTSLSPFTLAVPAGATLGSIRMRVIAQYNSYPASACVTGNDGEVEDYTLNIISACTPPTVQASSFTSSAISANSMTVGWTRGNGTGGVIVVAREAGAVNTDVSSGGSYTANAAFGSGTQVGTGNYVVYQGTGTSVNVTALSGSTTYHFAVYEYATSGTCVNDAELTGNATTDVSYAPLTLGYFISGDVVNNGTWKHDNDVNYITMNGTTKTITGTGTYTSTKLYTNGTITFDGVISSGAFDRTYVEAAKTFTVNTSRTYKNGMFINEGTTTLGTGSTFQNSGDWTNNNTVTANTNSTAVFNGSTAQVIGGSAVTTFYNATIANTSGDVSLENNETVQNTLTMTSGKLSVQGYTITVGTSSANGTISGGGSTNYIVAYDNAGTFGYVKHLVNANASYWYPIGDASNYTPLTFDLTAGTLASANVTLYTKAVSIPAMDGATVDYLNRYWDLSPTGITSPTYNVSYAYATADIVGTESELLPVKLSGATWYKPTGSLYDAAATEQGTGSVNVGSNLISWTGLSTFSLFGGANNAFIPLPVGLTAFNGKEVGENNQLFWTTSSEDNNDFFTIEKTVDGETFEIIGMQNGAGNANYAINYKLTDHNVRKVINYYRLKQTDYNGQFTYSELISIDNRVGATSEATTIKMRWNLLGQEVDDAYKGVVIILHTDGTIQKVIQ